MGPRNALCGQIQVEVDQLHLIKHMTKKKTTKIIAQQVKGESNEQYAAFLAYCMMLNRSIEGLAKSWLKLGQEFEQQASNIRLGKRPSLTTIKKWSVKYYWQLRAKKWDEEKKNLMSLEFQRVFEEREVNVARLFNRVKNYLLPQITSNRILTVDDFERAWKMLRTEGGLSTGKQELDLKQDSEISDEAKEILELWRKKHDAR